MSHATDRPMDMPSQDFMVPGTCFVRPTAPALRQTSRQLVGRDPTSRQRYLRAALAAIPRLLGAIDRNPYRSTFGCLDRQFWHYRTSSFPSEMYQEGVLPLALVYATRLPGNRWYGEPRVRELAVAGMRFAARHCYRDGACDDYYPQERALGAAVFSLQAAARAYQVLELNDAELRDWFERRARWIIHHDESGRLANHHALAALGLFRVAQITKNTEYSMAAENRIARLLSWQSDEGWFEEYGGADPGYQTVTIDCLAKIRKLTGRGNLDEPLQRAVEFARCFLHPDGSYAGEYGSRGTHQFYPHGMELLAAENADAADLADGFLQADATGRLAAIDDDRLFAHRLANLIEAYTDWTRTRPARQPERELDTLRYFPKAQILVRRTPTSHTVVSAARGGILKHFASCDGCTTDAGLIVETTRGRVAVSQTHALDREIEWTGDGAVDGAADGAADGHTLTVSGPLHYCRFETATPIKQAIFHTGMATVGRCCRTLVRRLLQRRLITGRRVCPIRLTRAFELLGDQRLGDGPSLRVTDTIELTDRRLRLRRMSFGTDHQTAYVAAANIYQKAALQPWVDLREYIDELHARGRVTIVREF